MSDALERVESALTAAGCHQRSGNWTCPVHEDREPSLSVGRGRDGKAILKCFAGCDYRDIVTTLGLTMDELFEEPLREVARYRYHDIDGVVFDKVRFQPKTFRWEPSLNGHKVGLYQVHEALSLPDPVYLVESEKDVDRLLEMGVAATCMPGGAGSWSTEYSESLQGRDVIIVADRDEPGIKHALKVQVDLQGRAAAARVLQSATIGEHDDIGDHLDAGFILSQLERIAKPGVRQYRVISLSETLRRGVPDPVLLCNGLLYEGGLHSIAGAPDSGKTTLALFWAVQLLREGKKVLILDEEGGPEITVEKLGALGATCDEVDRLTYAPFPARSWTEGDIEELLSFAGEINPALMLVDSSAAFLARAGLDENSAPQVTSWWSRVLTPVAREIGAAVLVIDHDTKASEASRYARGSGAKLAVLDTQYKVELVTPFTRQQEGILKLLVTKDRRGWLHRNWQVTVKTGHGMIMPHLEHDDTETIPVKKGWSKSKQTIYDILDGFPRGYTEINELLHTKTGYFWKGSTFREIVNELLKEDLVECVDGRGRENKWMRKDMVTDSSPDVVTPDDGNDSWCPF